MTDYQVPDFPQDPLLIKVHAAAGELLGIVARRLIASDLPEAARIVALLQEAAGARSPTETIEVVITKTNEVITDAPFMAIETPVSLSSPEPTPDPETGGG